MPSQHAPLLVVLSRMLSPRLRREQRVRDKIASIHRLTKSVWIGTD